MDTSSGNQNAVGVPTDSQESKESQTASDFIEKQLNLEADAREALPYKFDTCTYALGPLRQTVFSCLTCSPPPASPAQVFTPAGICYSCSISCHGEHNLVELFTRRNFVCDCGTTRMPSTSPCMLRSDPATGVKGAHSQEAAKSNLYSHNFENRFCACGEEYDAEKEKGTMFQCLGLGSVDGGGCGEDWWHPECLMGLPRQLHEAHETKAGGKHEAGEEEIEEDPDKSIPPGFPKEDDFESLVCYKCVEANPWIKQYAGTPGFLPPLYKEPTSSEISRAVESESVPGPQPSLKRKGCDDEESDGARSPSKRVREEPAAAYLKERIQGGAQSGPEAPHKHDSLPPAPRGTFSLFLKEDFREHFCHCPRCYPNLLPHPQLVEEEDTYEPPLSESGDSGAPPGSGARSQGTGSLLERGEAALSTMDRVRAIEGVMVYNNLKDKLKDFLKPYAESGRPVGAEDIKAYFEKLRGDDAAIKEAGLRPTVDEDKENEEGNDRREQRGY